MKDRILRLKTIACAAGIVLLMARGAEAAIVFSGDFAIPTTVINDNKADAWQFGGATPDVGEDQWFSARTLISIANEALAFTSQTNNNRSRLSKPRIDNCSAGGSLQIMGFQAGAWEPVGTIAETCRSN